jgi:hypothetical protein
VKGVCVRQIRRILLYGPLSLDNREIYAVADTLGTETGNATYFGLGGNQVSIFNGVAHLSKNALEDTAKAYKRKVKNTGRATRIPDRYLMPKTQSILTSSTVFSTNP